MEKVLTTLQRQGRQTRLLYAVPTFNNPTGLTMRAERRTKKTGSGVEFADHREYAPGDDFRLYIRRLTAIPSDVVGDVQVLSVRVVAL